MTSSTRKLWQAEESSRALDTFPPRFLESLRLALEAGMSCEQISSVLYMATAVYKMGDRFEPDELLLRIRSLADVIGGDRHNLKRRKQSN
jgi:hypothetical protein